MSDKVDKGLATGYETDELQVKKKKEKWLLTSYLYFSPALALFSLSRASCRPFLDFFSRRDREAARLPESDIAVEKPNLHEMLQNCQPSSLKNKAIVFSQ